MHTDTLQVINKIYDKYNLSDEDRVFMNKAIEKIVEHPKFKERLTGNFKHHSDISLGEHIIEDACVTYLLCKKKKRKINIHIAIKIAMFHDLYTIPWQNNKNAKVRKFSNKHGFRHPIEAVINAYRWYPELLPDNDETKIIIDGIIHHMFPLPVTRVKSLTINKVELKNYEEVDKIPKYIVDSIIKSTNRRTIIKFSLSRSKYPEGRILSKADKKVSRGQIKNLSSATALVTGKNKKIK